MREPRKGIDFSLINSITLLLVFSCFTGCDPVRRAEQTVVLQVSSLNSSQSGDAVAVSVSIREYHVPTERDKEFERFNPKRDKQLYPWTPFERSDDFGSAKVTYAVTRMDGNKGSIPPPSHYPLEGRKFRVRIQAQDRDVDEVLLKMNKGETAQGKLYRVSVESISNAVYVNPD